MAEPPGQGGPQRGTDKVLPDPRVDQGLDVPLGGQRAGESGGDGGRQRRSVAVEGLPRGVLLLAAGELGERPTGCLALGALDEQATVLSVAEVRGVRRRRARRERETEVELRGDPVRDRETR
ncbi:MAG: hypothetical protein ABIQ15_11505 [Nocardioides sp.]